MNEIFLKNEDVSREQITEKATSHGEDLFETIPATIAQIRKIEETQTVSLDADFGMVKIGDRVNADVSEIKAADEKIRFRERSKIIAEKQEKARTVFEDTEAAKEGKTYKVI